MRNRVIVSCLVLLAMLTVGGPGCAEDGDTLFKGVPLQMVLIEDISKPQASTVPPEKKDELAVQIVARGKDFEWANRGNQKLVYAGKDGIFETWMAANGSGYIRIAPNTAVDPSASPTAFTYVEHVVSNLGSTTYWGTGTLSR